MPPFVNHFILHHPFGIGLTVGLVGGVAFGCIGMYWVASKMKPRLNW